MIKRDGAYYSAEVLKEFPKEMAEITNYNSYRALLANSFEIVLITDRDDKINFCNPSFIKDFAIPETEDKAIYFSDLFCEVEILSIIKQQLLVDYRISNLRVDFKRTTGERLSGLVNVSASIERGAPIYYWTIQDITHHIDIEQKLSDKSQQLEKVNGQVEKFLYSTSHDLRSPLTTILGLVNLARIECREKGVIDYMNKIEASTLKLDGIIHDIMSYSRSTYKNFTSEKIDFKDLLWRIVNKYQNDAAFKFINFEINVQEGIGFHTDSERLDIILDGIIRNCIHYYDANKVSSFVRVNVVTHSQGVSIEIMDNGIGISHEHRDNVFKMFYKGCSHSRGAGLGLYIVKEGVDVLQGNITLESEFGFGTLIKINLPNILNSIQR